MLRRKAPAKKPAAAKGREDRGAGGKTCPRPPSASHRSVPRDTAASTTSAGRRGKVGSSSAQICSKEGCRKPAVLAGCCAEHKKGAEATEAAAPATPAAT